MNVVKKLTSITPLEYQSNMGDLKEAIMMRSSSSEGGLAQRERYKYLIKRDAVHMNFVSTCGDLSLDHL